jgi:hypothetical protein
MPIRPLILIGPCITQAVHDVLHINLSRLVVPLHYHYLKHSPSSRLFESGETLISGDFEGSIPIRAYTLREYCEE